MNKNFSSYSKEYFDKIENSDKSLMSIFLFVIIFTIFVFLIFFIAPCFFYEVVKVEGSSMLPTIQDKGKVGILKTKKINFGDIVVIDSKGLRGIGPGVDNIIKRVIGVEGDTIWLDYCEEAGEYRIYKSRTADNGEIEVTILDEPYIYEKMDADVLYGRYEVPKGYIFVIGDNRNDTYKDVVEIKRVLGKGIQISNVTKTFKFIGIEFYWYKTKFVKNPYKAL